MECSICLEEIASNESCHLECSHVFHSKCVLQAAMHDPRCPVCRAQYATKPESATSAAVVNIELTMSDVQNAFEHDFRDVRRLQTNYDARRRRLLRRTPYLQQEHTETQALRRQLREVETSLERPWVHLAHELRSGPHFAELKRKRALLLRRIRRRERIVAAVVVEVLGERPEIRDDDSQLLDAIVTAGRHRVESNGVAHTSTDPP